MMMMIGKKKFYQIGLMHKETDYGSEMCVYVQQILNWDRDICLILKNWRYKLL